MGTTASSAKQNPSKGPRQYLFSADVDVDLFRNENKIKITGPVEVVSDMLLYAEREGVNNGELLPYRSNQFGYLVFDKAQHLITQPVHLLETQNFIVPPPDMLNLSWSLNSLNSGLKAVWAKNFSPFNKNGSIDSFLAPGLCLGMHKARMNKDINETRNI